MRALILLCLTAVACTGSRRPVAKRLAVVQEVNDQEVAPRQSTSSGPWHQRQSRWDGIAHPAPSVKWSIPTNGPVVHPLRTDGTRVYVVAGGEVTASRLVASSSGRRRSAPAARLALATPDCSSPRIPVYADPQRREWTDQRIARRTLPSRRPCPWGHRWAGLTGGHADHHVRPLQTVHRGSHFGRRHF